MDSFSDFPPKFTYLHPSKCANKFGMVPKMWKALLTHFFTKSVPEWSYHMVYILLNSMYHI